MNTVANIVEKESIHLYRHMQYVKRPDRSAKKEYHSLVSPIVLKGGRSRLNHINTMKVAITSIDAVLRKIAILRLFLYLNEDTDQWSFAHSADTAPPAARTTAATPNHMKLSHVIMSVEIIVISLSRSSDE